MKRRILKKNWLKLIGTICILTVTADGLGVSWDWGKWWSYDGISGPQFWGLINPEWSLCTHGRRQSPVNIDPALLLFDPNLRPLHVDKHRVSGRINNTGHGVVFTLDEDIPLMNLEDTGSPSLTMTGSNPTVIRGSSILPGTRRHRNPPLNISGGPLSYKYKVHQVQLHFGSQDYLGSEHAINGSSFPAELQILGFNSQLFKNYSEALSKAHGVVGIAVMIQIGSERVNNELRLLINTIEMIRFSGTSAYVRQVSIHGLLPNTEHYITYDGSLTQPPCHETVTWIILNKPIYISKQQVHGLRKLHQGTARSPKAKMVNNFRPAQLLHHRPLRTNIDFTNAHTLNCPTMARNMLYRANTVSR